LSIAGCPGISKVKPAPFEYRKPVSLDEAALLLRDHGENAKILAGGQTLVPMLNFRLAAPAVIIDINDIPGLDRIELTPAGLKLGALVRWHQIEFDPLIAAANPLLREAVRHIAHYQIRNRGTWAGSCAHADPAAEFPAVAVACGAQFSIHSARGRRAVAAEDLFLAPLTTALEPDEILTDVVFPAWPAGRRFAFEEFALRAGDFAVAGAVALIDPHGTASSVRLVSFGVGDKPRRLLEAEAVVAADGLGVATIARAAAIAANEVDAQDDIHAPAEYRRALVEVLLDRALCRAAGVEGQR
jgi:carbon-monoxide dehydrogenase medium subunit